MCNGDNIYLNDTRLMSIRKLGLKYKLMVGGGMSSDTSVGLNNTGG